MSERDICTKFITPAITDSGWDNYNQIREEVYFTDGRIVIRKKKATRNPGKFADYILYYKPNIPLAVVEAKDNNHSVGSGIQQALDYADILDMPFVFSSNGDAFLFHDKTITAGEIEKEIPLDKFPSPEELWEKYKYYKGIDEKTEKIITTDYYFDQSGKTPRYYQIVAINRAIEAIAKGQDRILLVMATGTGKTYTAFQIVHRLWTSGVKKRILYLADRNILIDQTMSNDFKPLEKVMHKIKNRTIDKSYEVYFALYQAISGNKDDEFKNIYKKFSNEFFDLIIVDECHRGSAKEDSAWREILEYFEPATQIGLTATPKETKDTSNIEYFGEPLYTYTLKEGIDDGFLAPYKVIRVTLDKDADGFRPYSGQKDKYGNIIEDREYNLKDYDKTLILEQRTKMVAKKVSDFLKANDSRFSKTIFFCVDIDHAERMRQSLINENGDLYTQSENYVYRITGDALNKESQLESFIRPEETYPVLVTTSKLLSTGVDVKTCKYIILDKNINSMTEFKQIIGRGTRIEEDFDKFYFTIIDFRNATKLFADSDFDGDPVMIKTPVNGEIPIEDDEEFPPESEETEIEPINKPIDIPDIGIGGETPKVKKYYVNDVSVSVINERVLYYNSDGKLITEKLTDYTKRNVLKEYSTLNKFFKKWTSSAKKKIFIDELETKGIIFDALEDEIGKELDPFDLICHVAYDMPPLTRRERAENVKKRNYFMKYGDNARAVIDKLLDKYADEGIENLEDINILKLPEFEEFGSQLQIIQSFGGKSNYVKTINELESQIYCLA